MFLHFMPVDGVEYFPGILGWERYVFMFPENKPVDTALGPVQVLNGKNEDRTSNIVSKLTSIFP
jgi:hypothetical protein